MRLKAAAVFACLILLAAAGLAQVATSRLQGVVQDQSGAVVPGAPVTVVNNKTQIKADTTTNAQGNFIFPSLQPGEYTLSVEAAGFRKFVVSSIVLNVSDTVSQIIKLEVGAVTESVVVQADAVRVQTSDAQVGRNITLRDIGVLPQLGRTPLTLAIFANPGVQIDPGDGTFSRVNGTRQGSNNNTLDGIDTNDAVVPRLGLALTANNTDSVEEFRMIATGGKAEYGRSAGAQVELITRSGTNTFHGNAFDYLRNTDLNANSFFNNSAKQTINRPKFIQNMFGGSFGGPIFKDRTFFFGNYQGRRTAQDVSRLRTVLTPQAKAGLFRWLAGGSTQSFDVAKNDPKGIGIDKQMAAIMAMLPDPNNTDTGDGLNTAGFRFNNPAGSYEDQFTIKGDHNIWSANHAFLRWSWQRNSFIDSLNNADARYPGQPQGRQGGHRWGYAIGDDWTLTPRMVNEFRMGYQSANVAFMRPARLKGPMVVSNEFSDPLNPAFAQGRNSPVREFTDNVTYIHGNHTFKAGLNWRFTTQWGYNDAGIYPNVTLATTFGNSVPGSVGPALGTAIDSTWRTRFENMYNDVLGRMNQVTQTYYSNLQEFQPAGSSRVRNYKFHEYGYFFQDDWKVKTRFTLNLGLRWEFSGVPFETNKLQGTLDQAAAVNSADQLSNLAVKRTTNWYNNDWNNFAPRLGFAWDLTGDGKTALRGGFGIFYDRLIGATTSLVDGNTPGFSQVVPVYPNNAAGADNRVAGGIPGTPQPAAPVLMLPLTRSTSTVVFSPNLRTGYVAQYSLNLQREVFRNTVVDVGYVGNRGIKLFMDQNVNQPRVYDTFLQDFREIQAYRTNANAPLSAGNMLVKIFGSAKAAISAIGSTNVANGAVGAAADTVDRSYYSKYAAAGVSNFYLRNYPQYNSVILGRNDGRSYYDSLQVRLARDVGSLKFNANYTFSKSLDNISVDGNGFTSPIDNYNLRLNKGRGDYDRPHVFSASGIYALPIGQGHRFAGGIPRWADSLIGGWELGVLNVWESGGPVTFVSGRATGPTTNNSWVNFSGGRSVGGVTRGGDGIYWLSDAEKGAFSYPDAGSIGSGGRNAFRGPRFFNIDASLVKAFRITEHHAVSFRVEAYNLINNPNFGGLGTNFTLGSFGKLSSTVNAARIIQAALRYDF